MFSQDLDFWIDVFTQSGITLSQDDVNCILDHFGQWMFN